MLLRLYNPYDIDLIALRNRLGNKFALLVKQALKEKLRGNNDYRILIPDNLDRYTYCDREMIAVCLKLDDDKDHELVEFLANTAGKTGTLVIKEMIRSCYDHFPFYFYTENKQLYENVIERCKTKDEWIPEPVNTEVVILKKNKKNEIPKEVLGGTNENNGSAARRDTKQNALGKSRKSHSADITEKKEATERSTLCEKQSQEPDFRKTEQSKQNTEPKDKQNTKEPPKNIPAKQAEYDQQIPIPDDEDPFLSMFNGMGM